MPDEPKKTDENAAPTPTQAELDEIRAGVIPVDEDAEDANLTDEERKAKAKARADAKARAEAEGATRNRAASTGAENPSFKNR
jgi:hypothetical protein